MEFFLDFEKEIEISRLENRIAFTIARCDCNSCGCEKCEHLKDCETINIYQIYAREILADCFDSNCSFSKEEILEYEKAKFFNSLCYYLSKLTFSFGGENAKLQCEDKGNDRYMITLPRLFVNKKDVKIGIKFVAFEEEKEREKGFFEDGKPQTDEPF